MSLKTLAVPAFLAALLLPASLALGQSRQIPAPPQREPVLIHSATVHTVSGESYPDGYVLFDDGLIIEVGSGSPRSDVPAGTRRVDGTGQHVYPGLIASHTILGLQEVGAVDVTIDHTEFGRIRPEVRAAVAINPDSDLIPVARANGILLAGVFPQGGLISGRASTVRLDGWTCEEMSVDAAAGLVVNWPRTEPDTGWWVEESEEEQRKNIDEDLEQVERFFDEAEAYAKARGTDEETPIDLRFEAMREIINGDKPVFLRASSASQIESAVAWAMRRGYRPIIVGGSEADQVIPLLQKHKVPVIVTGTHHLPEHRNDSPARPFELPGKLFEAGIYFAIASGEEPGHERNLNHAAATAAAYGLPPREALKAVTLYPATILGLGERYGSIEGGKSATLLITNGDPLEITTEVLHAFIDGRELDLGSRHKALYDKYRQKYEQRRLLQPEGAAVSR